MAAARERRILIIGPVPVMYGRLYPKVSQVLCHRYRSVYFQWENAGRDGWKRSICKVFRQAKAAGCAEMRAGAGAVQLQNSHNISHLELSPGTGRRPARDFLG